MKHNNGGRFSFDGFKKWIADNGGLMPSQFDHHEPKDENLGLCVYSRLSTKKTAARVEVVEGDLKDLVIEFRNEGGTVIGVEEEKFLIEVSSGKFYLPRHCVRRASDE